LKNEDTFKSNSSADVNIKQLTYDMLDYDDFSHEGSLVIKDDNSLIVYNSCSHYGVINIINHIKSLDIFKEYPIKAYVGGLHLKGMDVETNEYIHSEFEIKELAKYFIENKIKVYTGHCTGDRAYEILGSLMATDNLYRLESGIEFNI
jgi:7,8-dihydropterin-6-yl-methyl-4-(beta-D-ribofuranosyl)aminobenzene 5'-phosphate synthase